MPDFLPQGLEDLAAFAGNFAGLLMEDASRFGLMRAEAESVDQRVRLYLETLRPTLVPATRNVVTLTARNGARAAMLQLLRPTAARIRANEGVDPADKAKLGLCLRSCRPVRTPAPATAPVLAIAGIHVLAHTLRYHDKAATVRRAKPANAVGMQLLCALGEEPADLDQGRLVGLVTRQPHTVRHPQDAAGQRAWYWGRWQTATGKVGPWSAPTSMLVAA